MSMRTTWFSSSNSEAARALHSSVFPVPDGPQRRKEPVGWPGRPSPARDRRTASATASTAASWPTTRARSDSARPSTLSRADSVSLLTGTPVQRETTDAISSGDTTSDTNLSCSAATPSDDCMRSRSASSSRSICFSMSGIAPYLMSAAAARSRFRSADSAFAISWSRRCLSFCSSLTRPCSASKRMRNGSISARMFSNSFLTALRRSLDALSFSLERAVSSTSSCSCRRSS
mmetsp:Transcript_10507/g.33270  ORF Transcript_10507/g.33270 Transcript_10507/m.33270 type:complete len:232 (+) Transcript_10507:920-1615(+)